RYFPDPDLVPLEPARELVERIRLGLPELPGSRLRKIEAAVGYYNANVLVTGGLDRLWEATVAAGAADAEAANVIANPFVATGIDPESVNPAELAKLVSARADIPRAAFDDALAHCGDPGFRAETYLAEAAIQAAKLRRRVALVEQWSNVGGVCTNTGTIPSKTIREVILYLTGLRERAIYGQDYRIKQEISIEDLARRTRQVVERDRSVIRDQLVRNHVTLVEGTARFVDPHRIAV